jgi:hypothetical protein
MTIWGPLAYKALKNDQNITIVRTLKYYLTDILHSIHAYYVVIDTSLKLQLSISDSYITFFLLFNFANVSMCALKSYSNVSFDSMHKIDKSPSLHWLMEFRK